MIDFVHRILRRNGKPPETLTPAQAFLQQRLEIIKTLNRALEPVQFDKNGSMPIMLGEGEDAFGFYLNTEFKSYWGSPEIPEYCIMIFPRNATPYLSHEQKPGAQINVTFQNEQGEDILTLTTDRNGNLSFSSDELPDGKYTLRLE